MDVGVFFRAHSSVVREQQHDEALELPVLTPAQARALEACADAAAAAAGAAAPGSTAAATQRLDADAWCLIEVVHHRTLHPTLFAGLRDEELPALEAVMDFWGLPTGWAEACRHEQVARRGGLPAALRAAAHRAASDVLRALSVSMRSSPQPWAREPPQVEEQPRVDALAQRVVAHAFACYVDATPPLASVLTERFLYDSVPTLLAGLGDVERLRAWAAAMLPVLDWTPHSLAATVHSAATRGHVHVLEWLEAQLPGLEWLPEYPRYWLQPGEKPTEFAIVTNPAVAYGHVPVLEWLEARGCKVREVGPRGVAWAVVRRHVPVLRWLLARAVVSDALIFGLAAEHDVPEVVEALPPSTLGPEHRIALDDLIRLGHAATLRVCLERFPELRTADWLMLVAPPFGHVHVLQLLRQFGFQYLPGTVEVCIEWCVRVAAVRWMIEDGAPYDLEACLARARTPDMRAYLLTLTP